MEQLKQTPAGFRFGTFEVDLCSGELRKDARVKVSGASGREVLVGLDKNQVRRQRVLIAKGRLYQIIYVGPAGSEATAAVNGFFDSFRLQQR